MDRGVGWQGGDGGCKRRRHSAEGVRDDVLGAGEVEEGRVEFFKKEAPTDDSLGGELG